MQTGRICKNKRNNGVGEESVANIDASSLMNRKLGRVLSQPSLTNNLIKNNPPTTKTIAPTTTDCER